MSQSHSLLLKSKELASLKTGDTISKSILSPSLIQHLKVLRIKSGEQICFLDGAGHLIESLCESSSPWTFSVREVISRTRSLPKIELALSLVKKEAFSQALTQATELGFERLQIVETEYSTVPKKMRESYPSRAERLIEAATEQCRSPFLASVQTDIPHLDEWLHKAQSPVVWADEDLSREQFMGFQQPLVHTLLKDADRIALLIGPEGGWSEKERALLKSHTQVVPLGLGPQILRVPTACTTAIALLKSFLHQPSELEEDRVL